MTKKTRTVETMAHITAPKTTITASDALAYIESALWYLKEYGAKVGSGSEAVTVEGSGLRVYVGVRYLRGAAESLDRWTLVTRIDVSASDLSTRASADLANFLSGVSGAVEGIERHFARREIVRG